MTGAGAIELRITLLPGSARLLELHAGELPQKDELCGPFWTLLALRAGGGAPASLDQDEVASVAGTMLSAGGDEASLPPGATGRRDYRRALPVTDAPERSGTSAPGLVRAVGQLCDGNATPLPLMCDWTAARVVELLELARRRSATVLLNVDTGELWGSRPDPAGLLAHLVEGAGDGPAPEWRVGHFIALLGRVTGAATGLAVVADTYPSIGWRGIHLQPFERLARALARGPGAQGGALLVLDRAQAGAATLEATAAGFTVAPWDNGSLDAHAG